MVLSAGRSAEHIGSASATLANRLRSARRECGWSQQVLAKKVGTSQAVIQKIENGKSLRPRKIEKIAEALGVTSEWLMYGVVEASALSDEEARLLQNWRRLSTRHQEALKSLIRNFLNGA